MGAAGSRFSFGGAAGVISSLAFGSAIVVNLRSSVVGFGDSVRSTTDGDFSAGGEGGLVDDSAAKRFRTLSI
jgi:hypothetical protein